MFVQSTVDQISKQSYLQTGCIQASGASPAAVLVFNPVTAHVLNMQILFCARLSIPGG